MHSPRLDEAVEVTRAFGRKPWGAGGRSVFDKTFALLRNS